MLEKQCNHCNQEIKPHIRYHRWFFEFGTKLYCSQACLFLHCEDRFPRCAYCKCIVEINNRIKFRVRFGTQFNQFCSSKCMESYKKETSFCKLCLEPISSIMMISNEEKFCSPFCISRYSGRGINQLNFENSNQCITCNEMGVYHLEMLQEEGYSIFFCSKSCVEKYKIAHGLNIFDCSLCGCLLKKYTLCIYIQLKPHVFCSAQCSSIFLNCESEIVSCNTCQVRKYSCDMINRYRKSNCDHFCSVPCIKINAMRLVDNHGGERKSGKLVKRRSSGTSQDSSHDLETDDEKEDENIRYEKIVKTVLNKCHTRELLSKILKARFVNTTEDKGSQWNTETRSVGTKAKPLISDRSTQTDIQPTVVPFPVYIPSPVPECIQFKPTPLVIPLPIPVAIPIPLLKCKKEKTSKETRLTYSDVAKQFILKAVARDDTECMETDNHSIEAEKSNLTTSDPETAMEQECLITTNDPIEEKRSRAVIGSIELSTEETCMVTNPVEKPVEVEHMTSDFSGKSMQESHVTGKDSVMTIKTEKVESIVSTKDLTSAVQEIDCIDLTNGKVTLETIASTSTITIKTESKEPIVPTKEPTATDQDFDCIDLTSDNENNSDDDLPELYLDISGSGSPEPEAMETDDGIANTLSDGKFLVEFIKGFNINKDTTILKEKIGRKLWTSYVKRKNKKADFMSKISHLDTESDKLSNADRTTYLIALLKDYVDESDFEPRLIFYIFLCLQRYLSSSCVLDSLFFSVCYHRFGRYFLSLLQNYMNKYSSKVAFYESCKFSNVVRIREEMLWRAYQLGSMSPNVLVFTVFYFNTKYFKLQTIEEHESATFKRFSKLSSSQTLTDGTPVRLKSIKYNYPKEEANKRNVKEIYEDPMNHWRCPVKINEFYTSKCLPGAVCTSSFYLTPVMGCSSEAKHWYTSVKLPTEVLQNMLNLTLMVEEIQNVLSSDV